MEYTPHPKGLETIIPSNDIGPTIEMVTMPIYGKHFKSFHTNQEGDFNEALYVELGPGLSYM